jgi:hypothetical protein
MEFVIELNDFACGATEREVVRRGWEGEANRQRSALSFAIKIQVGQVEVELRPDQIGATRLPRVPAHTVK